MRVDEVQHGRVTMLELEPASGGSFSASVPVRVEARLLFSGATGDALLCVADAALPVAGADVRSRATLSHIRESNVPRLSWVAASDPGSDVAERLSIQVHQFAAEQVFPEPTDMGVDEQVVEQIRLRHSRLKNADEVVRYLTGKVLLPPVEAGGSPRALLSSSAAPQAGSRRAFRLYGDGIAVDVARGQDERLRVVRVVEARRPVQNDERRPVLLVAGPLRFCDATVVGQLRGVARTQLDQIVEAAGSYLNVWKEYNALERESILRRARAFQWLRYHERQRLPDGRWRFRLLGREEIETPLEGLRDLEELDLEAAASPPPELLGGGAGRTGTTNSAGGKRDRAFAGSTVAWSPDDRTVTLQPLRGDDESEPPTKGYLFISLSGDRKRLARREEAQARIASAECSMPQLGLLIEGAPVRERRSRMEQPLSAAARAAFGGEPTPRQVEALRVALNTPDIALIQGPPGTGKTKTITALQIRLAEIAEDRGGVSGQTLLTSYQHDAVENAAEKTLVFGLPALKIGKKRGQTEEVDGVERWRQERIEAVRAELARCSIRPASDVLREVRNLSVAYSRAPQRDENAAALLRRVIDLAGAHVPAALADRLLALQQELRRRRSGPADDTSEDRELARKAVIALRVTPAPFSDDGPRNAHRALQRLDASGALEPAERALLEQAADWDSDAPPPFLAALAALQGALIDRLSQERSAGLPAANADVESLLAEVVDALYRRVRESAEGEEAVLRDYLDDLEHDANAVRDAIRHYTVVLASTCQHSVGYQMSRAKGDDIEFENVLVDEAARANPLDLFIPMSRARRRIILVGDHRQLPHILEPDVESQLEQSTSEATQNALRKSLFQRLFEAMQERERRDGIKRTVTLDVQYRMHPVLADFVSSTFYAPHGETFRSSRAASDFEHGLTPYGRAVAAWVDVPLHAGREAGGQSKHRAAEARWIAREVERLMRQRPDLGFGVITFYAAQVKEILRAMEERRMVERLDDGSMQVAASWRTTRDDGGTKERLRVGTVDAFQGKEFDVVFLSMTRSNDLPTSDERALRRKYGHLLLENRLCVAMSRQRRLLVLVGDAGMVRDEAAARAVPGLAAFHELCGGSDGLRIFA
ncbi:AAA domain-containing protein [Sorangium sp. So ce136]|uniref:DEAD/DEAH box helicase n=1 Tax=Sorangium sp. So ce136 TaxID=3133284 RepID=UPI003F0F5EBF